MPLKDQVNSLMKWIWNQIDKREKYPSKKRRWFLLCNTLFFALLGAVVWLIGDLLFGWNWQWGICLVGYPAFFFGYLGGLFFVLRR